MKRSSKLTITGLFVVYIGLLIKYILFRRSPEFIRSSLQEMGEPGALKNNLARANFTLFKTTSYFLSGYAKRGIAFENLVGNFVGFMPLGLLAPLLFENLRNIRNMLAFSFLTSFAFELAQLVTGLGIFDVDDLLLNTAGGVIGYFVFALFNRHSPALNS
ncbi:MAG: VanZ family protein [Williamsia sp.]|nr:VanZ family protein [Williamsia sp.]